MKLAAREAVVVECFAGRRVRWKDTTKVVDLAEGRVELRVRLERLDASGGGKGCVYGPSLPFCFLWPKDIAGTFARAVGG